MVEKRCPNINTCTETVDSRMYKYTCNHITWFKCTNIPSKFRKDVLEARKEYYKKPKEWETKEVAEEL